MLMKVIQTSAGSRMKRFFQVGYAVLSLFCATPGIARADAIAQQWFNYGQKLYAQRDYRQALGAFTNGLKRDRQSSVGYQGLGNCYVGLGDKANALKYYKYALQLNPQNQALSAFVARLQGNAQSGAQGSMAQAQALYRAKRYEEAVSAYRGILAGDPKNAMAEQGLGNALYGLGRPAEAKQAYQRSLALNPGNPALAAFVQKLESPVSVSWVQPAWRSALLPGWGQFYNHEERKGLVVGGLTLGLLAGVAVTYVVGSSAQQEYLNAGPGSDFDKPYGTWEAMASLNHAFYLGFGAAYLYNVIDAAAHAGHGSGPTAWQDRSPIQVTAGLGRWSVQTTVLEF